MDSFVTTIILRSEKAARARMAKGLTPLLFYSESCAQPTNNGLKSGFVDIGHSSPTSVPGFIS